MPDTQQLKPEEQVKAIHEGNFEKLCDMIKKGQLSLTATFKNEKVALHLIVTYQRHSGLLKWILENRPEVNINARSSTQSTPLIMAADVGNMNTIKLLIEYGADVEVKNVNNKTARDVLVRRSPEKVLLFDEAVKAYQDKKNLNQSLQGKKESLSNKPQSFLSSFSFLSSCLASSKKDDQKKPLIKEKTQ